LVAVSANYHDLNLFSTITHVLGGEKFTHAGFETIAFGLADESFISPPLRPKISFLKMFDVCEDRFLATDLNAKNQASFSKVKIFSCYVISLGL
jgi:hypothetical protein